MPSGFPHVLKRQSLAHEHIFQGHLRLLQVHQTTLAMIRQTTLALKLNISVSVRVKKIRMHVKGCFSHFELNTI